MGIDSVNRPILVLGAHGQVGRALAQVLGSRAIALSREQADLSHPETLPAILDRFQPSAVLNGAAYTQVDLAEKEEALAMRINGEAPGLIARWCAEHEVPLVHYSTDYVFPGTGTRPWRESDPVNPLNAYGRSKAAGERAIAEAGGRFLVFRTSWIYDSEGKNFLRTMLRLGSEKRELRVVSDQIGAPTYAPDLAQATVQALERFQGGIYHLCHSGETSWHGFAEAIFKSAREKGMPLVVEKLIPIVSADYPAPAKRPLNSRLDCSRAKGILGISLPTWQEGLRACMEKVR